MTRARLFTGMLLSSEISVLTRMHAMLEHDGVRDKAEFSDMMTALMEKGRLDPRRLADDLGYSISSVYRWIDGSHAPHPSAWPRVVEWMVAAIGTKLDELEKEVEPA
jgi:predicted DNA-binding transcriptional regulator AlpA